MELQKLFVTLGLKANEFNSGIEAAQKKAQGFAAGISGGIGRAFSTMSTIGTAAFLGVGAAAVGGLGLAMHSAISMNASLEQSTMMFTTLMGDADLAKEHVAGLFEFAAATPFETGEIITASKHLQVFGGEALNTQENLTLIGDAAAAVGAPFDEVAFWTGRMYSAIQGGQPFGEAAMRLQELGLMTPEVRTAMEGMQQTGADASEVWGAFSDQMGNFTGAMELQSGSWTGLMSTLKDNLSMAAAQGLKPFFDLAKEGLGSIVSLLSSPAVQEGIAAFAAGLQTVVGAIADFVSGIMSGEDPVGDFANLAWTLADAFGATQEQALLVFNRVRELGDKIAEFVGPIAAAVTNFVSFKDILVTLGIIVAAAVIPAIISIAVALAPIIITITAVIAIVALLRNAWENNWGGIQEKTAAVIDFIKTLISGGMAAIQKYWDENGARILATAKRDWEALKQAINTAIENIKALIIRTLADIKGFWNEHGEGIVATAKKAWELIQGVIDGVTKQLNLIGEAFRLAFEGNWEAFGEKIFQLWKNAWDTVVNFLSGLWAMVLPWLTSLWNNFVSWFTETDWKSLGRRIIDGIIEGINNAAHALFDIVRGLAGEALDTIKAALGISSPAKELIPVGVAIVEGIMRGIEEERPHLMMGIEQLVNDLDGLLTGAGAIGGIAGGFARQFERTVTDPMAARLDELTAVIEGNMPLMRDVFAGTFGRVMSDWTDPAQFDAVMAQLRLIMGQTTPGSLFQQQVAETRRALIERNALEDEYIRQQEKLFALEQARADLDFLKSQMELLQLIQANAGIIPAGMLDGLQFGLAADPGQLMDLSVWIMEALVRNASQELNLNTQPQIPAENGNAGGMTWNTQETVINGGQHNYFYGTDDSLLEQMAVISR